MPRARTTTFDDLIAIAARLPPWLSLGLAVASGLGLHIVATMDTSPPADPHNIGPYIYATFIRTSANIGQYVAPAIFILGALSTLFTHKRRQRLFQAAANGGSNSLAGFDWRQFESIVGGWFEQRGYTVLENDRDGADGGIDLRLRKEQKKYIVQCKHWRSQRIGVSVVRELYGLMAATGATGAFVVTSGRFTSDALSFAQGRNISLIDGNELSAAFDAAVGRPKLEHKSSARVAARADADIDCPRCGAAMVRRTARRGPNAGSTFWGCTKYPKCRGVCN